MPATSTKAKLEAVDAALECSFPSADIDVMLGEIERGYRDGAPE